MYIAHTVPGRYTLKPFSLVLYLEEEEEKVLILKMSKIIQLTSAVGDKYMSKQLS